MTKSNSAFSLDSVLANSSKTIRLLSAAIFLAALLVALTVVIPTPMARAADITSGDYTYSLVTPASGGTSTAMIKKYNGSAAVLTIPSQLDGYTVTAISHNAFVTNTTLTQVTIPGTVTTIYEYAFAGCSNLATVNFNEGLQSIGYKAFYGIAISSVDLPDSLVSMREEAFSNCDNLTTLNIPKNVTTIGNPSGDVDPVTGASVMRYGNPAPFCNNLTSFTVDSANTSYTSSGVALYTSGRSILIAYPQGNTDTSYSVPSGTTKIAADAFIQSKVQSVELPSTLTEIGDWAFQSSALTSLTIPDSVTKIGEGIAYNCTSLATATLGTGIKTLSYDAFKGCTSLTTLNLTSNVGAIEIGACQGCTNLSSVTGATGLVDIFGDAFRQCTSLTSLTLPDTLLYVSSDAFVSSALTPVYPADMHARADGDYIVGGTVEVVGNENYTMAYQVLDKVNTERAAYGLSPLTMDSSLLTAAMQRGAECSTYFEHTRPNGSDCFAVVTDGTDFSGENIAAGQTSAQDVMDSWMNSAAHKANILTSSYTTIGVGCFEENGQYYWVQCFGTGTPQTTTQPTDATNVSHNVELSMDYSYPALVDGPQLHLFVGPSDDGAETINVGDTLEMALHCGNATLTDHNILYSTSNSEVASIDANGNVTGVKPGKVTISATVNGSGGQLLGTVELTVQADISTTTVADIPDQTYTGQLIKPNIVITDSAGQTVDPSNYSVTYSNNMDAGTATATITGVGDTYSGTTTKDFNIVPADITGSTLKLSGQSGIPDQAYTGSAVEIDHTLFEAYLANGLSTNALAITFANNDKPGVATVTATAKPEATGIQDFTGTTTANFNIIGYFSWSGSIDAIPNQTFTGSPITPEVTVEFNGTTLAKNVDYTVVYSNNTAVGNAQVTVTGIGHYSGTLGKTFTIVSSDPVETNIWQRLSGGSRIETMKAIVDKAYPSGTTCDTVVLTTAYNYADALAASGFAGLQECPIITTGKDTLAPEAATLISRLKPKTIYVLGGTASLSKQVANDAGSAANIPNSSVIRISGGNRVQTSVNIYNMGRETLGWTSKTCILTKAWSFADALAISPYAYAASCPVFLTDKDPNTGTGVITQEVLDAISNGGFTQVIVLGGQGGDGAITDTELAKLPVTAHPMRISGGDRMETAENIALWATGSNTSAAFQPTHPLSYNGMGVANAWNYPDALASVGLLGKNNSLLLLVDDSTATHQRIDRLIVPAASSMTSGYVLGGTAAVPSNVETWLKDATG